jgi:septal ring factor EnvC (AmiA/AmiB activator)
MPQQQANIQTVVAMLTEQGRKLDTMKTDFDRFRDELPDDYAPRRETDKSFADMSARNNDHEARLRMIEARIPNTEFSAYKDTAAAREKAQAETAQTRFIFDERTQALLQGALLMLTGYLVYFLLSHVPLH